MSNHSQLAAPPSVRLVGEFDHPDFGEVAALVRAEARIGASDAAPELVIVAQSRPGTIPLREMEELQHEFPLSGIVGLLGSWCEGESRTGRPWPGIRRLFWYEFPAWWQRQLALRAAGHCPDWARPAGCGSPAAAHQLAANTWLADEPRPTRKGLIVLHVRTRDTFQALADVLLPLGCAAVWDPPGRIAPVACGIKAAFWEGGQLSTGEEEALAAFCRRMASYAAPVAAILDFPRRDRVERAKAIGASAVLGKPWANSELAHVLGSMLDHDGAQHEIRAA